MSNEEIYNKMFELLTSEDGIVPEEIFTIINDYVNCRTEAMNSKVPVHLYLNYPYIENVGNGFRQCAVRYNPLTKQYYDGTDWGAFTNAFRSSDGIYVDFPAIDSIGKSLEDAKDLPKGTFRGLKKAENIISFMFTLEHELQHESQTQNFEDNHISFDAWKYLKNLIIIGYCHRSSNVKDEMFYHNTHGGFFIEEDADNHAYNYLSDKLSEYNIEDVVIDEQLQTIKNLLEKQIKDKARKKNFGFEYEFIPTSDEPRRIEVFDTKTENIISFIVDDLILQEPDYVAEYPVFQLEYNSDGTRKTYREIREWLEMISYAGSLKFDDKKIDYKDVETLYEKMCDDSPLMRVQKLESQLERDLWGINENAKEEFIEKRLLEIANLIASENFHPTNALIYLEDRKEELTHMHNVCWDKREYVNCLIGISDVIKEKLLLRFKEMSDSELQEEANKRRNAAFYDSGRRFG